jgi:hypothetical protein
MARKIPLGRGLYALVDDDDYERVSKFNWHLHQSADRDGYYASSNVKMHRLIINAPHGSVVDHINGNKLDNRKENLRFCTHAENAQNTRSRGGSSRYKGVHYNRKNKKWMGAFVFNGTYYYCGMHDSEKDCARAVDKKRKEVCGEFATINLPETPD